MSTFRAFFVMVTRTKQEMLIVPVLVFYFSISDDEVHAQTSIHFFHIFPVTLCHGNSYLKGYLNDDAVASNGVTTSST